MVGSAIAIPNSRKCMSQAKSFTNQNTTCRFSFSLSDFMNSELLTMIRHHKFGFFLALITQQLKGI